MLPIYEEDHHTDFDYDHDMVDHYTDFEDDFASMGDDIDDSSSTTQEEEVPLRFTKFKYGPAYIDDAIWSRPKYTRDMVKPREAPSRPRRRPVKG